MSAFLEEIRNTTKNNKYKIEESIINDLVTKIQKTAEEGRNQVNIPSYSQEHRKIIEGFCKAHGFRACINTSSIIITW